MNAINKVEWLVNGNWNTVRLNELSSPEFIHRILAIHISNGDKMIYGLWYWIEWGCEL